MYGDKLLNQKMIEGPSLLKLKKETKKYLHGQHNNRDNGLKYNY